MCPVRAGRVLSTALARRDTLIPVVPSRARSATGAVRGPRGAVGVVAGQALGVGGDQDPGVQDLDQPAGHDDLDRLTGERRSDAATEPGQGEMLPR